MDFSTYASFDFAPVKDCRNAVFHNSAILTFSYLKDCGFANIFALSFDFSLFCASCATIPVPFVYDDQAKDFGYAYGRALSYRDWSSFLEISSAEEILDRRSGWESPLFGSVRLYSDCIYKIKVEFISWQQLKLVFFSVKLPSKTWECHKVPYLDPIFSSYIYMIQNNKIYNKSILITIFAGDTTKILSGFGIGAYTRMQNANYRIRVHRFGVLNY